MPRTGLTCGKSYTAVLAVFAVDTLMDKVVQRTDFGQLYSRFRDLLIV